MIEISELTEASDAVLQDLNRLLPQLRSNPAEHFGTLSDLQDIVQDPHIVMLVLKDDHKIIGMGSLYVIQKVGRVEATIEDIVVDERYRGKGLGEKITSELIEAARLKKVSALNLTSNPKREAANKLYQKLGFIKSDTNTYRMKLQ